MPPAKRPRHPSTLPLALAALVASTCPLTTRADTATWASAVSGNWTDAGNWLPGVVPNNGIPPGTNYDALINATGSSYTVTLSAAATINSLTLNSPTATLLLPTISPGQGLFLNAPSNVQAGTIELLSNSASSPILDLGNSDLTLSGASTSLVIDGGTVQNGTITTTGGAAVTVLPGPYELGGSSISSVVFENATVSLQGQLNIVSTSSTLYPVSLLGTGTFTFDLRPDGLGVRIYTSPWPLIIGPGIRLQSGKSGGGIQAFNSITNEGTISAQTMGLTFGVNPALYNMGLVQAINGGTVLSSFSSNTGQIYAGSGSFIDFYAFFQTGGSNAGLIEADGGSIFFLPDKSQTSFGSYTFNASGTLTAINGGLLNFSTISLSVLCPISLSNSSAVFNSNSQSIVTITGTGFVSIGDGKSLTSDGITANSLQLGINSTHTIRPNTGGASIVAGASKLSTLTLAGTMGNWSSLLDLTNNALIIQATDFADKENKIATLLDQVNQARGGLANSWTGTAGITSSTVAAADHVSTGGMGLAVADAQELPDITNLSTYRGQTVDNNSIIIVAAHTGDVTLDGRIDISDLNAVTSHWQQTGALWSEGDTAGGPNGGPNGTVDIADLNAVTSFWQYGTGSALVPADAALPNSPSPVPEPISLALLALAAPALLFRRHRKCAHPIPCASYRSSP